MQVFFINNGGGGFADNVEVKAKTKVADFFKEKMEKGANAETHLIRVNRDIVEADYVPKDGDRVTITPLNIQGA